jgi:putative transposase
LSLLDYIQTLSENTPTKAKSKRFARRTIKGCSTANLFWLSLQLAKLSFIVACHLQSAAKISIVKSLLWCQASFMANKKEIYHSLPEFAATCPSQIRQYAIKDAHDAVKAQKVKCLKTGQPFQMKFRSRKNPKQIIKFSIQNFINGLYKTKLGILKMSEQLPDNICDAQLTLHNGQYHMVVPFKTNITVAENQGSVVALDPGVRTFQTFFSPESCGEIGKADLGRIYRLCAYLDDLMSRKQWNAAAKMRIKIKNLVKELHHKTAHFFCSNFRTILLPTFETSQMVSKKNRKIRTKTARAMMSWCHYEFKLFIKNKAKEFGCEVIDVCEAYTSKTCSWTGELINVGSSKTIKSKVDGRSMDRDINGARGIFIRALVDNPCDEKSLLQEVAFAN